MRLPGFSKGVVLPFVIITFLLTQNVNAQTNYVRSRCMTTSGDYEADSDYKTSLDLLLSDFTNKSSMSWYEGIFSPDKVYGLFYCRGDVEKGVCRSCVQAAASKILEDCPTEKDAVIWFQECTLRYYANNNSDAFLEEDGHWVGEYSLDNVSDPSQFLANLTFVMTPLINKTAYGSNAPGYATGDVNITKVQTLHCLVQCSPFVTAKHCDQCLQEALDVIVNCCSRDGRVWVMIFNPSCQMRYGFLPFNNLSSTEPTGELPGSPPQPAPVAKDAPLGKDASFYVTRVVVPVAVALVLLLAAGICFWRRRKLVKVINRHRESGMSGEHKIEGQGAEKFSFGAMKKATGSFSDANRLGQGGFGAVYKGKLQNGEEVAIKRLSKESRQGNREFSTEVLVVAKLQHRNLVRLLGYCEEKKERLLVYEYVPNLSLDQLLFDPSKSKNLDWRTRYTIISGIARGLRYLHHESRLNIVHRDLKTSNILLDADMIPKIADFGLAKLISLEHTQGDTTKVAGTLGYMAPEYIFQGHFSTKADVYSFGVILLEIVSGQKICKQNQSESNEGLLQRAWRHWEEGNIEELLDPTLRNDAVEVTKLVQIALLCVQHDPSTRPSMQMVLSWLNNNLVVIPSPVRPAALAFDTSSAASIGNSSSNVIEFTESTHSNSLK